MFCRKCGEALKEEMKFCAGCGNTAEQHPDIRTADDFPNISAADPDHEIRWPSDDRPAPFIADIRPPVRKHPAWWKLAALAAVVVLVIAVAGVALFGKKPAAAQGSMLVYATQDDQLMFRKDLSKKTKNVQILEQTAKRFHVHFSEDDAYLLILADEDDTGIGSLYLIETARIGSEQPKLIARDAVAQDLCVLKNGAVIYRKGESVLLHMQDENIVLAKNLERFEIDREENWLYYSRVNSDQKSNCLRRISLNEEKREETVIEEYEQLLTACDAPILYYSKKTEDKSNNLELYSQEPKGTKTKLMTGICSIAAYLEQDGGVAIYYTTQKTDSRIQSIYERLVGTGGDNEPNALLELLDKELVKKRMQMRMNAYTLTCYKNGEPQEIATGLCSDEITVLSMGQPVVIYGCADPLPDEVWQKEQTLEQLEEILQEPQITYFQYVNGNSTSLELPEGCVFTEMAVVDEKQALLRSETTLVRYDLDGGQLVRKDVLTQQMLGQLGEPCRYYFVNSDAVAAQLCFWNGQQWITVEGNVYGAVLAQDGGFVFRDVQAEDNLGEIYYVNQKGEDELAAKDANCQSLQLADGSTALYIGEKGLYCWKSADRYLIGQDASEFWLSQKFDQIVCQVS